jgi:predicted exporter
VTIGLNFRHERSGTAGTLAWALLCILAAGIAARTTYTTDLSAFLPRSPTATQQLLVEQLREGPAARLIVAAIDGADAATRAQVSTAMSAALRKLPEFAVVTNGDAAALERDRRFLFAHRYVLSDAVTAGRFSARGLHAAIADSIDALASPEGPLLKPLFAHDPTGELLNILDGPGSTRAPHSEGGVWSSRDGTRALLLLQTGGRPRHGRQQTACTQVRRAFANGFTGQPDQAHRAALGDERTAGVRGRLACTDQGGGAEARPGFGAHRFAAAERLPLGAGPDPGLVPVASGALAGVAAVAWASAPCTALPWGPV